jgi:acetyl esterase/lipase
MGDSAGGNLAAALVHRLKDKGRRLPASLILMSPWLDLAPDSASALKNRDQDSLFDKNDLIHYSRFYIGDSNYRDPDLSPLRADVGGFPPTLLQVAENELLYFDSLAMIEKLKDAGVEHEVIVEQNLFHSWQLFPDFIPEAKQSLQQAANFILKVRKAALQHHEQSETAHVESTSASV